MVIIISKIFAINTIYPDSKGHGANMGPTWVLSAPDGPHVGPMNLAIRVGYLKGCDMGCLLWGRTLMCVLPLELIPCTLKLYYCCFDEISITGCTGSCHFDNFQCSQWWKFHQNDDISVSMYATQHCDSPCYDTTDLNHCHCSIEEWYKICIYVCSKSCRFWRKYFSILCHFYSFKEWYKYIYIYKEQGGSRILLLTLINFEPGMDK